MSALFTRNRLIGLVLAALVAVVDQAVKLYVIGPLALRQVGQARVSLQIVQHGMNSG